MESNHRSNSLNQFAGCLYFLPISSSSVCLCLYVKWTVQLSSPPFKYLTSFSVQGSLPCSIKVQKQDINKSCNLYILFLALSSIKFTKQWLKQAKQNVWSLVIAVCWFTCSGMTSWAQAHCNFVFANLNMLVSSSSCFCLPVTGQLLHLGIYAELRG